MSGFRGTRMNFSGLLTLQKERVPLKSIEVELEVRDHVATVVSTLNYENKKDKPLEAVFVFPLPGDAAVCHFSAKIGQTQIVAEVKEKQKAREEYDDALNSGQQAFLLEGSDQSPDIFSLSVGSLPPGESASIRLEYVTELAVQADDGLRFCLPAVLNPRFNPQYKYRGRKSKSLEVVYVPASWVPYTLSFSARVSSPRPISKVESNCSLDPLQYLNTDQTQATVKLAAGHKFDRDVELLIYYKDAHQPTAVVEAGQASAEPGTLMGDPVVMVSLYPEFPETVMSSGTSCGEFVFLMDRSGSMDCAISKSEQEETRMSSARDAVLLLLKSLPMGCYFNIYSFGSSYEHIFPKSVEYSQETMEEALKNVDQMEADLGGSGMLEPLKHIYNQPCIPSHPRQLFVFTDGEVWDTKEVIDLVKKNSDSHRCFSFGIGEGASSALINGMAKEGGGHAQFITGTDRMQAKVMQSLRFALHSIVTVIWDLPKEVSVTVLSPPIAILSKGQRSLIYAQLTGQSPEAAEGCVTVKYSLAGHPSENQLHFSLRPAEDTGLTVHRLGARSLIRSLEREHKKHEDGGVKEKLVQLSVQSGVNSSFTAFIPVNKDNGDTIQGRFLCRNIPKPFKMERDRPWRVSRPARSWSTTMNCSGLLNLQKEPVPLKSIEVELEVRDHVATVVSTLNYENKEDKPLEAVFVFPLPGDAAVCHFSAKIGQTQIVAEVKEKQKAHEEYDDDLSFGQQTFLLEESDQSPDIFSLSVGSLPPGESAYIRLEYVTELAVQADDGLRFCLPGVLNPQYKYLASLVPYSLSFSARVSSPRPISKVESNCSLDPLQYLNTDQTQATVKLAAGHKFDRDVELLIYYKDAHQPTAVVEAGQASAEPGTLMGDPVVMVSLYPEFPETVMSSGTSCGEFVFLMDRSGSMDCAINKSEQEETRMSSARDAVLLLLKNLPMGCYFNIYSFGSSYEHIFPKSVEYSQETMEEALKNVDQMEADLGGSGMLEPLKHIYNQPCIPSHPRQLFVFTDGEVWDTKEVIDLVKKNSDSHRCFSFGIGEGASSALINGMAKEGGGHAQFITGTDRMQAKVMQSLRFSLHPIVTVIWDLPKEVSVTVLSPPITTLFKGQRSLIYARLTGQSSEAAEGCVTVKYSLAGHPSENQLHFSLRPAEDTGLTVHRLGARSLIRSLEIEDREHKEHEDGGVKEQLVQLSVQSEVSSSFTAFIPVNKDNGDTIQGCFLCRNIATPFEMERDRPWRVSRPARSWSTRMNCSGLLNLQKEPVPLKSIEVQLEVRDHVATVVSILNYENKEDKPLEAVFVFPLPGDAAVCHFSAKIGQTQIVAKVKEKQKARKEYDDALSSGQQAFLLEESDQSPDIFSLSVGSLLPGESASIRLEYVTELAVQADDGLRFCLPAVLNPRYQPQDFEGAGVQVTSVPASLLFYRLSFSARVSSPRPISTVESNCSLDPLQYLNTDQTQATVKLAAGHKFDRDVELLIYYKDAHQPTAVVEAGQASAEPGSLMGDSMVMVSLYPEFPQSVMASCGEFVFLMDRSGSMSNTRIRSAKDTLLLLLKSLPMGCYFNIYGFGSRYEHIFPKSVEYTQQTMEEALKSVEQMQADLGGTEILEPLKHIYSQPCIPSQPRQLFVFTDGEVGNTKEVIDLVKKKSDSHRCFSFGIGEGASSALINGMAKEGGGHAQFITGTDRMQAKVMQSLRFALQPVVVGISVTWDLPKEVSVTVLSPPIKTLFQGQRSLIYAQLTGQRSEAAEGCVTVKYSLAGHPSENQLHFSLRPAEDTGLTVHRLGARTLIRSLEMEERESRGQQDGEVKKKLVRLSVQSGVSSSFTAFIAVNKANSRVIQGPLVRRNIPTPMTPRYGSALRATPIRGSKYKTELLALEGCSSLPIPDTNLENRRIPCLGVPPRFGSALPAPPIRRSCSSLPIPDTYLENRRIPCLGVTPRFGSALPAPPIRRIGSSMAMCSIPDTSDSFCGGFLDDFALPKQPPRDPFMHLVSLQKASGSWLLDPGLATALGKTSQQVEKIKPRTANSEVWATILALVWLHAFKMDAKDEWEFLALKAASWLRAQNAPCVSECVESGNVLLGCSIKKEALGL
ncbi:uncharacterized protein LOC100702702 isoform X5 [Oreochromis niloticus]|uniref:uncharacterized protein LOC100702702 isoform X5 n=1 Tax=Oreochromis niloticus TaxID=8128 RepID=UPI000DF45784|nr:uncharacterized protein LOC100702702 isoform X5 [Oreochromis niloticus]